jgi:hypothetical protein
MDKEGQGISGSGRPRTRLGGYRRTDVSFLGRIFGAVTGVGTSSVIGEATNAYSAVFGNKAYRELGSHMETMSVHEQHASEFQYRGRRTWFDSLIDGINRLVRPLFTLAAFYVVFIWPYFAPTTFLIYSESISLVPQAMWMILGVIVTFWFGSRALFKDKVSFATPMDAIDTVRSKIGKIKSHEDDAIEDISSKENKTLQSYGSRRPGML